MKKKTSEDQVLKPGVGYAIHPSLVAAAEAVAARGVRALSLAVKAEKKGKPALAGRLLDAAISLEA